MKAKRISLITVAASVLTMVEALACEVCKKQQPKVLRGITHGAGPQSDWDYVVVGCAVILVLISLFYAVKWIMHPGEKEREHVKNSIFN
jgi:phage shock protein PspC (stress-responsive transcriptional regulator)